MQTLTEQFTEATVQKDEAFRIQLDSEQCGAGYLWELTVKSGDATHLDTEYVAEEDETPAPEFSGEDAEAYQQWKDKNYADWKDENGKELIFDADIKEIFTYKAGKSGPVVIEAKYVRPWETNTPPKETKNFTITVV